MEIVDCLLMVSSLKPSIIFPILVELYAPIIIFGKFLVLWNWSLWCGQPFEERLNIGSFEAAGQGLVCVLCGDQTESICILFLGSSCVSSTCQSLKYNLHISGTLLLLLVGFQQRMWFYSQFLFMNF